MRSAIKQFSSDTKGTFGILLGLLLLPMTLSVLMGMEYFRLVEFRDKLDSVATQVAMASAGGKERSETQRLSDGRLLLTRVMAQHQLNAIGNTGTVVVKVRGGEVTSTVKLEAVYKYEFGAMLGRSDTKLAVERTIKQRKPGASSGGKSSLPEGVLPDYDDSEDLPDTWSY